jgi:nicotinamide mononucleotide transporter
VNTATIDVIGALLSIISGYFYIKEKPVAFLISLIAIPFDVILDLSIGVYGDLFLQFIYFVLLIYGWHSWRKGSQVEEGLPIVSLSLKHLYFFGIIAATTVTSIWMCLNHYTNSEVALLDACVTGLSLMAQWLLCRKIIESWLLWIFVDCLYVSLYAFKLMPFHAFVSLFDAGVCISGYMYLAREYKATTAPSVPAQSAPSALFEDAVTQSE